MEKTIKETLQEVIKKRTKMFKRMGITSKDLCKEVSYLTGKKVNLNYVYRCIHSLRKNGVNIISTSLKGITFYTLGKPSRRFITNVVSASTNTTIPVGISKQASNLIYNEDLKKKGIFITLENGETVNIKITGKGSKTALKVKSSIPVKTV